jgi:hypothetical protein
MNRLQRLPRLLLSVLLFCGALGGINLWLAAHRWLPAVDRTVALVPTPELALIVLLLALAAAMPQRAVRTALHAVCAFAVALVGSFAVADGVLQQVWQRGFIPQSDLGLVRGGLLLLFGEIGPAVEWLTPVTIALIGIGALVAAALLVSAALLFPRAAGLHGRLLTAVVGVGLMLTSLGAAPLSTSATATMAARIQEGANTSVRSASVDELVSERQDGPAGGEVDSPAADGAYADGGSRGDAAAEGGSRGDGAAAAEGGAAPSGGGATEAAVDGVETYELPGIKDRDIFVFVLESYGYAAYNRDELYRELDSTFTATERRLSESGFHVASHFFVSPVSGGRSWMAEATFFSGQRINRQDQYEALFESGAETLPSWLDGHGYYTMMIRPGTVHGDWPEGRRFYALDEMKLGWGGDFDYHGPDWSYVPVPDQFSIWKTHKRLRELEAAADPGPLFVNYQLVSSHTPFNRIPEYLQEWSALGDGSIYRSTENLTFDNSWTGGSEYDEGYVAAIDYSLTVVSEYLSRFVDQDSKALYIIYGDHQPLRPVRVPDARLSVPIHVISRDPEMLEPFLQRGYVEGFIPSQQPPHPGMEQFFPMFVEIARGS